MKGKSLIGAPELCDRAFEEYVNETGDAGLKLQVRDNAKSLVLAKVGREDFVNPTPFVRQDGRSRRHRRSHQARPGAWIRPSNL